MSAVKCTACGSMTIPCQCRCFTEQWSDDLRLELITRASELQVMSDEKAEIKAMVNELRESLLYALNHLASKDPIGKSRAVGCLSEAYFKSSAQSLHDNNLAIAEKVREACAEQAQFACLQLPDGGSPTEAEVAVADDAAWRIRSLDLSEVVK